MTTQCDATPTIGAMAQTKADERRRISVLETSFVCLMIIGSLCIILGVLDLIMGFIALLYGSLFASIFTYAWAGFIFALVNGSLVLRAAKNKPHVSAHWANVTLGFGVVSMIMQFVDVMFAFQGMISCRVADSLTVRSNVKETSSFYVSPVNAEAVHCVIAVLLFLLEVWQIAVSIKLRRFFSRKFPAPVALHFVSAQNSEQENRPPAYDSHLPPPYVAPPDYAENYAYVAQ